MPDLQHVFDDSRGYERSMGPWSRTAGTIFLNWLEAPASVRWLDVGCGTGVVTKLILDRYSPASVVAVDSAVTQIARAKGHALVSAQFGVADAQALPFADQAFDVAEAALVFNFVPDPPRAIDELHRVTVTGGMVAGFVWDFAAELSPTWPLRATLQEMGLDVPRVPGSEHSTIAGLTALFEPRFKSVCTCSIEAVVRYCDFSDYWESQTMVSNPLTNVIGSLTDCRRREVMAAVRSKLGCSGELSYAAHANAIKGIVAR